MKKNIITIALWLLITLTLFYSIVLFSVHQENKQFYDIFSRTLSWFTIQIDQKSFERIVERPCQTKHWNEYYIWIFKDEKYIWRYTTFWSGNFDIVNSWALQSLEKLHCPKDF